MQQKTIKRKCLECDKEFFSEKYQVSKGRGKYCSVKCSSKGANRHQKALAGNEYAYERVAPGLMRCSTCKQLLPLKMFPRKKSHNKIHKWYLCSPCRINYHRQYRKNHLASLLLTSAKRRAKKNNVPFSLTLDDIKIPTNCPILGLKLESSTNGKMCDTSPTLDRLKPKLGYVSGNVLVVSARANRIKSDGTATEHFTIAEFIKRLS